MKAILVTNMPECCNSCHLASMNSNSCVLSDKKINNVFEKPKWCPLKPLPEKAAVDESMLGIGFDDFNTIYYLGFNECIDKILGETE